MDWLNRYTFPVEARCSDAGFARETYERAVRRCLSLGTTTCSYFGTIHLEASKILCEVVGALGQRALIGKVNMDRNAPGYYIEGTAESLAATREFVEHVKGLNNPLVMPIITPRFVPTCTSELMTGLGEIARDYDLHIQSHVSENVKEIEWVRELHPEEDSYVGVYRRYGLLTRKTVLAHGCHLTGREIEMMRECGAGISHCASSNFSLGSGVARVRQLEAAGVAVGLGTDVAGGASSSMLDALRQALSASAVVSYMDSQAGEAAAEVRHTPAECFYLATLGGARVLRLDDQIGTMDVGKAFDALVVEISNGKAFDIFPGDSDEDKFSKWLMLGDDRNIKHVYVQGKRCNIQA